MTRVLVIEPAGRLWGSERALLDLIRSAKGMEIAVCCPLGTPLITELKALGVRVEPWFVADLHTKSHVQRLRAAVGVLRACLSFRPDIIHLNQSGAYRVVLPASILLGIPVVGHVRIFEDAAYLAQRKPDPRRLRALIAISDAIEREIASFESLKRIPTRRVYDAFVPTQSPSVPLGSRMPGRVVCVGRIAPIKGQEVLLEALASDKIVPPGIECLIVGMGEESYVRDLRKMVSGTKGARVSWTGFIEDVGSLLSTCQVLVCPSHREPLGRVILEAWNAGAVPLAYGGAGGAAEIIRAARGGIIYDPQTPEALASALAMALRLPAAEIDRLIANGRAWMAKHCGTEGYCRALSTVFEIASGKA